MSKTSKPVKVERVVVRKWDGRRIEVPAHTHSAEGWCPRCQSHGCTPNRPDTWDDETMPHAEPARGVVSGSLYERPITAELARHGRTEVSPAHVEGYMRIGHSTLDGLSPGEFSMEVEIALACIDEGGIEQAERNARSFGLGRDR